MPELKTESGKTIHYSYTKAGIEAYKKRKAAEAKKKKPASKKKKATPKKKAYNQGGLTDADFQKKMATYNKRVAEGKRMYLTGAKLRQYTGPKPMPKKKYKRGGLTPPPTKQEGARGWPHFPSLQRGRGWPPIPLL